MRDRIVGDPGLVERNRLAIEEVGQGFVGGRRIAERTCSQINPTGKVFVQLAIKAETHTKTGAVAVWNSVLDEVFTAYPDIAIETEAANQAFQGRHAFLLILRAHSIVGERGFDVGQVAVQLDDVLFLLVSCTFGGACLLLSLRRRGLGLLYLLLSLLRLLLRLLQGGVAAL